MTLARLGLALALTSGAGAADTARYFDPWHADGAVIAPDGQHVAYFLWVGERKSEVVIADCDYPTTPVAVVLGQRSKLAGTGMQKLQWANPSQVQALTRAREWWSITLAGKAVRIEGSVPEPPSTTVNPSAGSGAGSALDPTFAALCLKFPDRTVEVTGWDNTRNRAVLLVTSRSEPGRYFLYDHSQDRLTEFVRRMPRLRRADLATVRLFAVRTGATGSMAAMLAEANLPPAQPNPVVVFCRGEAAKDEKPHFEPELHALVAAGFTVIEFAPPLPEASAVSQVSQALTTLLSRLSLNSSRVGLVGTGSGAILVSQAVARHPEQFRCAAIIDGPLLAFGHPDARPFLSVRSENGKLAPAFVAVIAFLHQQL